MKRSDILGGLAFFVLICAVVALGHLIWDSVAAVLKWAIR